MKNKDLSQTAIAQTEFSFLLNDLSDNRLVVKLILNHDGQRWLRAVESRNPSWYSELFNTYSNVVNGRKSRSLVRRVRINSALKNLTAGIYKDTFTYNLLMDLVRDRLYNGYYLDSEGIHVPPQLVVEPWE